MCKYTHNAIYYYIIYEVIKKKKTDLKKLFDSSYNFMQTS